MKKLHTLLISMILGYLFVGCIYILVNALGFTVNEQAFVALTLIAAFGYLGYRQRQK